MAKQKASYPKVYAEVISYEILAYKSGILRIAQELKPVTPEEFAILSRRNGKRRWYSDGFRLKVRRLDTGEEMVLGRDEIAYGGEGKARKNLAPGVKIKMYNHPKDSRPWRYKFTGE